MGVQQLIANNTNVLIDAAVIASTVTPSAEISRTAITRAGTGLVELSGLYTGHTSADYDVEIVTGEGNGRASAPVFSGVGSGTLAVTAAGIPAQDVTITLLTPPYPGATAEARVGFDIVKAASTGGDGNLISISVDRSGLTFAESGSSTLEAIAEGGNELTPYKWDIPGVICSTDLKGNLPADAPRLRFGADPTIYRIAKDSRNGTLKTILSPAAVWPVPAGAKIWIVSGAYSVTVTDGTDAETYAGLTTGYDLMSALLSSTIVQPAYTPAPVTTIGGNAAVDLPLVTGSTGLLSASSSAAVRPEDIIARSTAFADTIKFACKGNGSWSVSAASGTVYPDAFEGRQYAPATSPVLLTIPAKPQPATATATQPVFLADRRFVVREDDDATLPLLCIEGALGINATPKTITATYAVKPSTDECPCPTDRAIFSSYCLGLENQITGGGEDVDPTLKAKLTELYSYREAFVRANTDNAGSTSTSTSTTTVPDPDNPVLYRALGSIVVLSSYVMTIPSKSFSTSAAAWAYVNGFAAWVDTTAYPPTATVLAADVTFSGGVYVATGTRTFGAGTYTSEDINYPHYINGFTTSAACAAFTESILSNASIDRTSPSTSITTPGAYGGGTITVTTPTTTTLKTPRGAAIDIAWMDSALTILADALDIVYADATALAAWDVLRTEVFADLDALKTSTTDDLISPNSLYLERYRATVDNILLSIGIVPGKSDTLTGSTGCWEDYDAGFWWRLSDGYAPAFTGVEYYSTRAGSFENSQEFAFMIKCGCEDKLQVGDTLTIQIGGNLAAQVWSSNEFLEITTIPTTPLYLAGGKNPDDAETWSVTAKDSSNAALPTANLDTVNRGYSSGGLEFTLIKGGIPFSVGDRFTFTVEGGTFKWRKNAGNWSSATPIANGTALDSGLFVNFLSGSAPSFVTADSCSFTASQTNAATGLQAPTVAAWSWTDTTATITLTIPTSRTISTLACLHSLPIGTAIAVDYTVDGTTFLPLTWASGVIRDYLHVVSGTPVAAIGIRITVDHPGSIRWIWAGVPLQPELSAELRLIKKFDMARAKESGSAVMLAQGTAASLAWDLIYEDDAESIAAMINHVKSNGDEPVILIPHHLHSEESIITRVADDGFELVDLLAYQPDDTSKRLYNCAMELTPEWR